MLHARIAARAFNTPLLVEPSKAMAFLSGLGPRLLGRRVELTGADGTADETGANALPACAGILAGGLLEDWRPRGDALYPMVDGIAVIEIAGVLIHRGSWIGKSSGQTSYEGIAAQIEAAAGDPQVRGVALEIDSFGGEVAGVFDLADRIRALCATKPVWAFVAEHAFSAGYALAAQADRILLPRTGAVGSIGVVVMHADLSGQLDREGVRVTLIHSGRHKIDGNPYVPLPVAVRDDIQREIDGLRALFAQTVAAGRGGRLPPEAALATEAATYRGAEAIAAGLADEVVDLAQGFAAFRQRVARGPGRAPALRRPVGKTPFYNPTNPREEDSMATPHDPEERLEESPEQAIDVAADLQAGATDDPSAPEDDAAAPARPHGAAELPVPAATRSNELAELSAQLREAAAEIAEIAAQAGRLGIAIDAAQALREGATPEALRRLVLERAAAAADARDIVAAPPSPILPPSKESPIVAAARRAAASGKRA